MQIRKGRIKHEFIKSRKCPGEWILGRDVDIVDKYREDDGWIVSCDIVIPATGRFERFNIPEDYIDYTDGENIKETIPSIDSEQVVHEG